VLAAVGLPDKVRGEELGLESFLEIHRQKGRSSLC
jgi:hypothetical protein